ncbi:MAG: preprotein translocase subunit YajC [Lachnospiraceae bacterium]|nr:preprotein translocase subunit YajC [Lachnospiraceae bacterium]
MIFADAAASGSGSWLGMVIMTVALIALMYFMMIRPQQKETKRKNQMLSEMAVGDTVLTTSGFYGILIDMSDEDTVIVEFGNNKNCRIPMQKAAIAAIEKAENAQ